MKNFCTKSLKSALLFVILMLVFAGCGKKKNEAPMPDIIVENHIIDSVVFKEETGSVPVEITFVNLSGIDIGMLSMIDPATHEQLNIAGIEDQTSLTIGANWPKAEEKLNWALYNMKGELCIEGASELTGIKESATIVFSGEGNVTNIDVQIY